MAVRRTPSRRAKRPSRDRRPPARFSKRSSAKKPVGAVTHYYGAIKVGIVKFSKPVKKGTVIRFEGATTHFVQPIVSLQYDHKDIALAPKGKEVGVKVKGRVREGDLVFLEEGR